MNKQLLKPTALFLFFLSFVAVAWSSYTLTLTSTGIIVTEKLELREVDGVTVVSSIDWGACQRGQSYSRTYRLYNLGNVDLNVTMTHNLDATVGSLSWDSEFQVVPSNGYIPVTFTLTINPSTTATSFSFTISIVGV